MKLTEVVGLLDAEILCGNDTIDFDIDFVCAGDLMSDILVFSKPKAILLTGLVNVQAIRTSEMLDFSAVVFIRDKKPSKEMLDLARQKKIVLLSTPKTMYLSCGLLYESGLKNVTTTEEVNA